MKPLIVAATRFEIQDCIPLMEEKQIPFLITGVGMTATAYALGKKLADGRAYSQVLNVGIAGSFRREIALGELLYIQRDTFYELGAEDGEDFLSIDELGFGKGSFQASAMMRDMGLLKVDAITVNKTHGNQHAIDKVLKRHPQVTAESMEGAAVFYVCAQEQLPCMQVRAISNYVERRDKSAWRIDLALKSLNDWLYRFLLEN